MFSSPSFTITFVGAGNLATHLARALFRVGFTINQVYSRTLEAADLLARSVQAEPICSLSDLRAGASLYIVALKDSAFVQLLPEIVRGREDALWVHTAGSLPLDVWKGHGLKRYGVFYPMQTFSKQREVDFAEIPLFVEAADRADVQLLQKTARRLTPNVYEADSRQRKSLHLAAVFACNFTNHLYTLSADLLQKYHLPFDVMLPLIDETARKVHELPPHRAQTGPAVRYDENVMSAHLAMLADEPRMADLYRLLSESIHKRHTDT